MSPLSIVLRRRSDSVDSDCAGATIGSARLRQNDYCTPRRAKRQTPSEHDRVYGLLGLRRRRADLGLGGSRRERKICQRVDVQADGSWLDDVQCRSSRCLSARPDKEAPQQRGRDPRRNRLPTSLIVPSLRRPEARPCRRSDETGCCTLVTSRSGIATDRRSRPPSRCPSCSDPSTSTGRPLRSKDFRNLLRPSSALRLSFDRISLGRAETGRRSASLRFPQPNPSAAPADSGRQQQSAGPGLPKPTSSQPASRRAERPVANDPGDKRSDTQVVVVALLCTRPDVIDRVHVGTVRDYSVQEQPRETRLIRTRTRFSTTTTTTSSSSKRSV